MNQKFKILLALLALLVVALVWFVVKKVIIGTAPVETPTATTTQKPNSNIQVTKTDITQNGTSKLPAGFPPSIPVDVQTISDSYKAFYKSLNTTQYTVSYTSKQTPSDLWALYETYLTKAGYKIDERNSSRNAGQISGSLNNNSLS